MTFGERLRSDTEPQLTQQQLGVLCRISQKKLSRIELDITEPNLDDIRRLCDYFKVSFDYFLEIPKNYRYPDR